jgi:hypothetical protein
MRGAISVLIVNSRIADWTNYKPLTARYIVELFANSVLDPQLGVELPTLAPTPSTS